MWFARNVFLQEQPKFRLELYVYILLPIKIALEIGMVSLKRQINVLQGHTAFNVDFSSFGEINNQNYIGVIVSVCTSV